MLRTLKIFLLILGMGIFILPKQTVSAQNAVESCTQKVNSDDCCSSEKTSSCHSESSQKKSQKDDCGDDCNNCHSCTVHLVLNYISSDFSTGFSAHSFATVLNFGYGISFNSSSFQNIWQPPKIG